MTLEKWGYNEKQRKEFLSTFPKTSLPGRVLRPGRGVHRVVVEQNNTCEERNGRLSGKAMARKLSPVAGDWVVCRDKGGTLIIDEILGRKTEISRTAPGESSEKQVIGANVDVLYVVQSLGKGRGFTPRGLERYMTMAWESGARPVVVLSKSDLSEDPEGDLLDASAAAPGASVLLCSIVDDSGIEELREASELGETAAFVGPSGSGKTSLINRLAGKELGITGSVRENDARGRHTTTARELHLLPDGRILMDTPGLRELQVWGEESDADSVFPEIEEAAAQCRFRDCRHETEPGCGVRIALEEGRIDPERFDSWLELRRELAWLETRRNEKSRKEYEQRWLDIAKQSRWIKKGKEVW